jgi:hypothetical protein
VLSTPPFWHELEQVWQVLPLQLPLQRQLHEASNSPPFWQAALPLQELGNSTSGYVILSSKPTLLVPIAMRPYPLSPQDVPQELAKSQ